MELFYFIFMWAVGVFPAAIIGLPGALLGNAEVKRLCRKRKELGLDDRTLVNQAGKAALFRTLGGYLVAVPVLLAMDAGAVHFPVGFMLLIASGPGMIAITIASYYSARSKVTDMLAKEQVPEEEPSVSL